jgi:hypothetical protein
VLHRIQPLRSSERELLLDRLAAAGGDVGQVHPTNANAFHPLQVFGYPFLGDVAARPMPPGTRLGRIRRVLETLLERIAWRLRPHQGQ